MDGRHPDRDLLQQFLAGSLPERESQALERHLFVCPACEERLVSLLPDSVPSLSSGGRGQRGLLQRLLDPSRAELEGYRSRLARERDSAARLWREVEPLDQEARRSRVWEETRFHTWGFFEHLIDRAYERVADDARRAEDILRLALDVAEQLGPEEQGPGAAEAAKSRAWTWLGNALRVLGDFRQAEVAFQTAELYFFRSWLDPLDEALLLESKAPLRRAQGRFEEAVDLLDAAIAIYREVNEPHLQGRALAIKGLSLRYKGDLKGAADCFRTSLFLLDGLREPRLLVAGQFNLILCLHDSGRSADAAQLIPEARRLMEQAGARSDLLRLRWTEGVVAAALGRLGEAEEAYLETREAFLESGMAFDSALVSLDLAALYLQQGRAAETRQIAQEMIPVFQSRDVYREALAALIAFQSAAEMEELTLGLVHEITAYLQRARNNPHLRFREADGSEFA
ncbi:MAG: zf-HC2 domain-containing protein [Thermoanaerobaculia bacterium]